MVLEILCAEPIYPQYLRVLELDMLGTEVLVFEVLGSESVKKQPYRFAIIADRFNTVTVNNCDSHTETRN